jgi:hypothetical protein
MIDAGLFRPSVPSGKTVNSISVNGEAGNPGGTHHDTAVINPNGHRHFEIVAKLV